MIKRWFLHTIPASHTTYLKTLADLSTTAGKICSEDAHTQILFLPGDRRGQILSSLQAGKEKKNAFVDAKIWRAKLQTESFHYVNYFSLAY